MALEAKRALDEHAQDRWRGRAARARAPDAPRAGRQETFGAAVVVSAGRAGRRHALGRPQVPRSSMRPFAPPVDTERAPTLEALEAAEALFEAARIGIWFADLEEGRLWWSRLTRRIHEVPADFRPTLAKALDFYPPDARARVEAVFEAAITTGARWDETLPALTFRGRRILLRSCGFTVRRHDRTRSVLGTVEDVTHEVARAQEHERLALVVQQMTNAAVVTDRDGRTLWANDAFERLTGRPSAQFLGRKPGELLQGPETDPATVAAIGEAVREGRPFRGQILNYDAERQPRWIDLAISPIRDAHGAVTGFVGIQTDVTARRAAEATAAQELEARRTTETLLRDVIDAVPAALSAYGPDDRLLLFNRTKREWFPRHAATLAPGMPMAAVLRGWLTLEEGEDPAREERIARQVEAWVHAARTEVPPHEIRLPDGRWLLSTARRSESGNLVWIRTDITPQKQAELEAREQARRDPLTGLLNRPGLLERLKALRARWEAAGGRGPPAGCLVVFDVDHFKAINDAYGHDGGDALLQTLARRAVRAIRENDLVARLGGDEFALFLPRLERVAAAARVEQILRHLGRTVTLGAVKVLPSLSAGVALAGVDGADCEELLRNADRALFEAKRQGRGRIVFYADRLAAELADRHQLAERLRQALAADRIQVALQPQFRLGDMVVTGFEALARWHDGERAVPPAEFVAAAEEHGLAERLGRAVLDKALAACAALRRAAGRSLQVGVNVTTAQLLADDFADQVLSSLTRAELGPDALELEVTETVLLDRSFDRIRDQLLRLRSAGVRIALDDFGTGYASLNHVGTLPVQALKIDRSFTSAIGRDRRRELITRTIVGLARGLRLDCVAEGVETPEQLKFLESHGCSHVQGFLTGRPMPLDEAIAFSGGGPRTAPAPAATASNPRRYLAGLRSG